MIVKTYDLDFYQAFKIVMEGGCVKGDGFMKGIFMRLNSYKQLVIVTASELYSEETTVFLGGMLNQRFRKLDIQTVKELDK